MRRNWKIEARVALIPLVKRAIEDRLSSLPGYEDIKPNKEELTDCINLVITDLLENHIYDSVEYFCDEELAEWYHKEDNNE